MSITRVIVLQRARVCYLVVGLLFRSSMFAGFHSTWTNVHDDAQKNRLRRFDPPTATTIQELLKRKNELLSALAPFHLCFSVLPAARLAAVSPPAQIYDILPWYHTYHTMIITITAVYWEEKTTGADGLMAIQLTVDS